MKNYLLPAISACLFILVVLALPGKDQYALSAAEMMERIGDHEYIIAPDHFDTLEDNEARVLVDLRDRDEFMNSHLPGAVNLPAEELDVESIREFFEEPGNYVLYAEETSLACLAWILITQMGIDNVVVLETTP